MLFVKKIEPSCSYCQRGKAVTPDTVLCKKKGVIPLAGACSAFRYDPLKRVPPRIFAIWMGRTLPYKRATTFCYETNHDSLLPVL